MPRWMSSLVRTYREAFTGLSPTVWRLAIGTFVNRCGTMVLPFFTLYLTEHRGVPVGVAGGLLGCYGFGAIGGAYLGGWLCDRVDPIRIQRWSLGLSGIGFGILAELESTVAIGVAMAVQGLIAESFRPANAAALALYSEPADRVRAFTLYRLAINLGMSVGPVVGGLLAAVSYRYLFWVDGASAIAAAAYLAWAFRSGKTPLPHKEKEVAGGGTSPWRDRPYLVLMGLGTVLAFVFFQIQSTYPLALHRIHGLTEAKIGILLAINTVIIVALEMVLAHALAEARLLRVVAWGSFFFCGGLALLPLGSGVLFLSATVVVWTIGEMLSLPFLQGIVAVRAGAARRGSYLGLLNASFATSYVVAPTLGTKIFETWGSATLWAICGGLGVFLLFGFLALEPSFERERTG